MSPTKRIRLKRLGRAGLGKGLELYKVAVPIGVVGAVFESRPDALVHIAALSLKSGNAVILKDGSEASHSNRGHCLVKPV